MATNGRQRTLKTKQRKFIPITKEVSRKISTAQCLHELWQGSEDNIFSILSIVRTRVFHAEPLYFSSALVNGNFIYWFLHTPA